MQWKYEAIQNYTDFYDLTNYIMNDSLITLQWHNLEKPKSDWNETFLIPHRDSNPYNVLACYVLSSTSDYQRLCNTKFAFTVIIPNWG